MFIKAWKKHRACVIRPMQPTIILKYIPYQKQRQYGYYTQNVIWRAAVSALHEYGLRWI